MEIPFTLETDLERRIAADPVWQEGIEWGKPRTGHLEGAVKYHIADIFANIERQQLNPQERTALRFIALVHDSFKYKVNDLQPRTGHNHHAYLARVFAEKYLQDPAILNIIELHDEVYLCWRVGQYKGKWERAYERIEQLRQRMGAAFPLYVRFFYMDSMTESKNQAPVHWLEAYLKQGGLEIPRS